MLLLAGCSYVNDPDCHLTGFGVMAHDFHRCRIISRSGAGNYYIAHSILSHLDQLDVSEVFVLWSGLSRIDIPGPLAQAQQLQTSHINLEEDCAWIHSGGWAGTWTLDQKKSPNTLGDYFRLQYSALDWDFINQQSLMRIAGCLNTLEVRKIPYRWGFIYDIYQDHSNETSLSGAVKADEPLLKMLPWDKFVGPAPYDYCLSQNLLSEDRFHPTREGWRVWFENLGDFRPKI
jgi:hypothetical protein